MTRRKARTRRSYGRATLQDVALAAGVSSITVSRVLRTPELVADDTRDRVRQAISRLRYIPNDVAGSLASTRSRTVAAIIPTFGNSIFTDVLQGMVDVLRRASYQLVVGHSDYDVDVEEAVLTTFMARQVDAVMLTGGNHTRRTRELLERQGTPVVETWSMPPRPIMASVGFSNVAAAQAMVGHLARRGHGTIGFVSAPVANNDRAAARREGFVAGLREHGLSLHPDIVVESEFGLKHGSDALRRILHARPEVDAIFFANDTLATGGVLECHRSGVRVPDDLAIAGFDDLEIASQIVPPLTTVRVPRYRIGRTSAELLLGRLEGADGQVAEVDVGFEIVVRSST